MKEDELKVILEISRVLSETRSLRGNLTNVLEILNAKFKILRGFILIHNEKTDSLEPVAITNLSIEEFRRLERLADKSVLKRSVENGKPIIIPRLKLEESLKFLNSRDFETSLVCIPINFENNILGILAAEFDTANEPNFERIELFLLIIASMIVQILRLDNALALERQKLLEENTHLRQELKQKHDFSNIIGNSSPMRQVYDLVTQVARSNATVLLRGESGTGKEMIASAIHYNSLRSKKSFVAINCAALPEALIEAELFGYEKGAFTGADKKKIGRFELAEGGTLFLDEIGDLPTQTQIKLLRVLQEREFERVGGTETIKINVRLITATNKNLEEEIAGGNFREDLFYRLNVFAIFLPPLRERKSDILLLAEHFLEKYEIEHKKRIRRISTPAIDMLTSYHYPGNVRELENAIERAVLVCDSNVIHGHHLPPTLQTADVTGTVTQVNFATAIEAYELDLIQDALKTSNGNIAGAARLLDVTERIIRYKITNYNINPRRFK